MDLSPLLIAPAVKVMGQLASKKRLFQELGELAAQCYGLNPSEVIDGLQDRESLGATGVGNGIALPHSRLHAMNKVVGLFMRLEKPLDYESVDRQPVDLIFALFAPSNAGVEHLKALALVSRSMRSADLCAKLRANNDPAKLYAILTETRGTQAA